MSKSKRIREHPADLHVEKLEYDTKIESCLVAYTDDEESAQVLNEKDKQKQDATKHIIPHSCSPSAFILPKGVGTFNMDDNVN